MGSMDQNGRLYLAMAGHERRELAIALIENDHSRTYTATVLGISRRTLLNKIKLYGLTRKACRELVGDVLPKRPPAPLALVANNNEQEPERGSQAV